MLYCDRVDINKENGPTKSNRCKMHDFTLLGF